MKIKVNRVSPRQKMINLMYIILLAMLAMNISSDVLNGFTLVDESLNKSTDNASIQNNAIYTEFASFMEKNPEKVREWYEHAIKVKNMSDSLYQFADELKTRIVQKADGKDGDVRNIINKEDLEAPTFVMLAPGSGRGQELFDAITAYRENILAMVTDSVQQQIIRNNFSTEVPERNTALGRNWQEYNFENTPVAAAVTLLTKLQNDIRYAEGEVLHTLVKNIDVGDVRVNELNALVIPVSQNVVRGSNFSAQIILAAVDTTQRPAIYIDDKLYETENGWYNLLCNKTGDYSLNGYMEFTGGAGDVVRRDFTQKYTVVDPTATVSASMMNVLYAGYDNPISISVPGVPNNRITASISNGNGTLSGTADGGFIARPSKINEEVVIAVIAAQEDGRKQSMGQYSFRVRQLPDPTPFIEYADDKGNVQRYRGGGTPLSKQLLMNTDGIVAAIDDGLLNIGFKVLSFETVFFDNMGNAVPEVSQGAQFSSRQKDLFRKMSRGKRFYISRVKAIGPDGIERQLTSSLEVIVN